MNSSEVLLGSITTVIDCEHKTAPLAHDEIYAYSVGTRALSQNFIDLASCKPVTKETFRVWSNRGEIEKGDIILAREAPVGGVGLVRDSNPRFCLGQRTVLIKPNRAEIDSVFLNYLFQSNEIQRWFANMSTGSTVLHINVGDIKKLPLRNLPNLQVQKKIANILQNLELRIETNILISKLLEEIALTIFKSWFVDFEPVKAKMVGRKPVDMDDSVAILFPDSMEKSEFGPIPSGWKIHSLSDIGEFRNGLAMQKFPVIDDGNVLPVIKIAQLRAGNTAGADLASGLIDPKFVISDGDILFSWSGTLEIEHWAGGTGALNQHLFKVLGKTVPNWFVFSASRNHLPEFRKIAVGKATTMGHIQRAHLVEAKVAVPPIALLEAVDDLFTALFAEKVSLLMENRTLNELRDALLPRLISGELQIPEEMMAT